MQKTEVAVKSSGQIVIFPGEASLYEDEDPTVPDLRLNALLSEEDKEDNRTDALVMVALVLTVMALAILAVVK